MNGGTGCSGFVREAIEQHGYKAAVPLARARFRDCKSASQTLRQLHALPFDAPGDPLNTPGKRGQQPPPKPSSKDGCDCGPTPDCSDCFLFSLDASDCGQHISCAHHTGSACDLGACDASMCDAGACHFGACDCCSWP